MPLRGLLGLPFHFGGVSDLAEQHVTFQFHRQTASQDFQQLGLRGGEVAHPTAEQPERAQDGTRCRQGRADGGSEFFRHVPVRQQSRVFQDDRVTGQRFQVGHGAAQRAGRVDKPQAGQSPVGAELQLRGRIIQQIHAAAAPPSPSTAPRRMACSRWCSCEDSSAGATTGRPSPAPPRDAPRHSAWSAARPASAPRSPPAPELRPHGRPPPTRRSRPAQMHQIGTTRRAKEAAQRFERRGNFALTADQRRARQLLIGGEELIPCGNVRRILRLVANGVFNVKSQTPAGRFFLSTETTAACSGGSLLLEAGSPAVALGTGRSRRADCPTDRLLHRLRYLRSFDTFPVRARILTGGCGQPYRTAVDRCDDRSVVPATRWSHRVSSSVATPRPESAPRGVDRRHRSGPRPSPAPARSLAEKWAG